MRQFVVIGLGNFGSTIAKTLYERGCQVLAIDSDKKKVQDIRDLVSQAIVMDARDRDGIFSLPIHPLDIAIVSLGDEMEVSILVTLYLKELGLKEIMVKAISEDHAKILKLIGASDAIFPEQQMAVRLAERLAHPYGLDFITLGEGFSMAELIPLKSFYGKSLLELDVRRRYQFEIVAVKYAPDPDEEGLKLGKIKCIPSGDYIIVENDILVVIGEDKYIEKYKKM